MMEPLPKLTDAELKLARQMLQEHSPDLLAFLAMLQKLIKTAIGGSDEMLRSEIIAICKSIEQADPILDQWGSRIDRAKMDEKTQEHKQVVATMAPARPPLKRGRGMVKVVTSQSKGPTAQEVFDAARTSIKRPHYIQEDDEDDDIPF